MDYQEQYNKTMMAYDVTCPVCGKRWEFVPTSQTGMRQIKGCNHIEMEDLIKSRIEMFVLAKPNGLSRPFANTDKLNVKMSVTYSPKNKPASEE